MGIKITGFDEMSKKLKKLQKNITEIGGSHRVSFSDLFNQDFMQKNTEFSSIDEMFSTGKLNVSNQEEFEAISAEVLNSLVQRTTNFANWDAMKQMAANEYGQKLLDKALKDSFQ
ncbi:hypothetical protein [Leptospira meyeri]|uniref:hypothetical protein n=1 Tax=Leptospira meyeri TaxID=29508 RepID=UPI0002BDBF8A|nr:hypothetical protein [Leptospira meyeri]EMJ90312.1 hypothetical protein LEP1GSC196_0203 [Leptospira meyeri serovar Semaranga str. Veldrot Semarang 173]